MTFYEKHPERVEARQFGDDDTRFELNELAEWCGGIFEYEDNDGRIDNPQWWTIYVAGRHARPSDYIVKRSDGSFFVMNCKAFESTYQEATA